MAKNSEFELTTRILNDHFMVKSHDGLMLEERQGKDLAPQIVSLHCHSSHPHQLYRFDAARQDFLPFFRNTDAPEQLRSFCDYILLYVKDTHLYIMLIEMKRGNASNATVQIDAGKCFMDYIIETALRIKDTNGFSEFSRDKIHYRRIILKPAHSPKQTTMHRRDLGPCDEDTLIEYKSTGDFLPNEVC